MRVLLVLTCLALGVGLAFAEKPSLETEFAPPIRVSCEMENIVYDWHFNVSEQGFTSTECDDGGVPVWEYGEVPDTDWGNIWITQLYNPYPNDAGEGLLSPAFMVDESTYLVEVEHLYTIEPNYDGCNVKANGEVIHPMEGYPDDEISDSTSYYAWCVDGQPGFTDTSGGWVLSCFDLSAFIGQEVELRFDFGSDSSVQGGGWGIRYVRVGGGVVARDGTTWSVMKGLYR